ncbi:hypothetical protein [Winogradskyella sp. MIT101101]|uniref:hypothetical protein n=1 Tax=Winogradskyella sp. MIT101101 TaxID=3098297 RepID=UPI00399BA14C
MNVIVKVAVILIVSLVSSHTEAQTNFEKGMTKAFELWEADKWDEAENMFERIAKAEDKEWLPNYYIAQINSLKSWNEKDEAVFKSTIRQGTRTFGFGHDQK